MSARRQGGQLRAILVRKIRSAGISEEMVAALKRRNQKFTGNLANSILKRDLSKRVRISYTINKELDVIENVTISFTNFVNEPSYAEFVDSRLGEKPTGEIKASARTIESWIFSKVKNGIWKSRFGDNYVVSNNYLTRKEKRPINKGARGGNTKTYYYPLVGSENSKKSRASLAFLIARSINEKQRLKNRTPYFAAGNIVAEFAMLSAIEEFNQIWLEDIGEISINKVISIFQ